jgi:uncharacterized membrane protein
MKPVLSSFLFMLLSLSLGHIGFGQSNKITDFATDIAPILLDKCLSCHEGEKAKNGFDISDRDAFLGFVEPGDAVSSSLWTDYLTQPSKVQTQDSLVMPPDGPLKASELATFKLWIDEGAEWPMGTSLRSTNKEASPPQVGETSSLVTKWYRAIGYFHPAMVHFPIALFFMGGACAVLSYFLGARCQTTAFQCLVVAALTSVVTVVMGWSFADTQGYPAWNKMISHNATHDEANFFYHRWLGVLTVFIGLACVLLGLIARRYKSARLNHAWRIGAIALAALVGLVGHQGGELHYGDIFEKAMEQLRK